MQGAGAASSSHTRVATEMMTAASRCAAGPLLGDIEATTTPTRTAIKADMSNRVREAVRKWMRQTPILTFTTSEADSCSDEHREPWQKRMPLKPGI